MNEDDRLNLKRMIGQSDFKDNTDAIRKLKHSALIRKDLDTFRSIARTNDDLYLDTCRSKCAFLYNNYTDIFNRLLKSELDIRIFERLLEALRQIEDGTVDQNEGSVAVGTILKEMYIDSALKHSNNILDTSVPVSHAESKEISWKQFKILKN